MMKVILENKFINDTVSIHKIVCRIINNNK